MDEQGAERLGNRQALNREELTKALLEDGLLLCKARSGRVRKTNNSQAIEDLMTRLELLLRANISVVDALELASETTSRDCRSLALALLERIRAGSCFSEAIASMPLVFDPLTIALIGVGEETGELRFAIGNVKQQLQWQREIRKRLRRILIYPLTVGSVLIVVMAFLLIQVVPAFSSLLLGLDQTLPRQTQALLWLSAKSDVVAACIAFLVMLMLALCFVLSRFNQSKLWLRRCLLRLPLLGTVTLQIRLARFSRAMAELTKARVDLLKALEISNPVLECAYLERGMEAAYGQVLNGESLSSAMSECPSLPADYSRLLRLGEISGQLPDMFMQLSDIYDSTSSSQLALLEAVTTPVLMTVLGGLLMWIVLAVLGPIYDVLSVAGSF